jgi:CarD family transcriptional regulator
MYRVGTKVVYPTHGVGLVEAIQKKDVSGRRQSFYILRIIGSGMTIMVPTENASRVGLREVIEPADIPKVIAILRRTIWRSAPTGTAGSKIIWSGSRQDRSMRLRSFCESWSSSRRSGTCLSGRRRCWRVSESYS